MSDELNAELRRQIEDLKGQVKEARDDAAKRRTDNRALKAENAELSGKLTTAAAKVTDLEGKVGQAPAEAQTKIAELTSTVRDLTHKAIFRERAAEAGVDPKALDTLWRESGYKAEADEADPAAIDEAIGRAKDSHPFLFRAADPGTTPPAAPPRPPLGGDRGTPPGSNVFRVTEAQLADPAWKQQNQAAFAKAGREGTLQIKG